MFSIECSRHKGWVCGRIRIVNRASLRVRRGLRVRVRVRVRDSIRVG